MSEQFTGTVVVYAIDKTTGESTAVTLDARQGEITVGAVPSDPDLTKSFPILVFRSKQRIPNRRI